MGRSAVSAGSIAEYRSRPAEGGLVSRPHRRQASLSIPRLHIAQLDPTTGSSIGFAIGGQGTPLLFSGLAKVLPGLGAVRLPTLVVRHGDGLPPGHGQFTDTLQNSTVGTGVRTDGWVRTPSVPESLEEHVVEPSAPPFRGG